MARQHVLRQRGAPVAQFFVEEMVLRRPIGGPEVLRNQLQHLLDLSRRPNITVRIVPLITDAHPGLERPFLPLYLRDGTRLAYTESPAGSCFLEEQVHIDRVSTAWRGLHAVALSPEDSMLLIASLVARPTVGTQNSGARM